MKYPYYTKVCYNETVNVVFWGKIRRLNVPGSKDEERVYCSIYHVPGTTSIYHVPPGTTSDIVLHDFNDDDDTLENLLNRIKTIAFSSKNYYSYFNRP